MGPSVPSNKDPDNVSTCPRISCQPPFLRLSFTNQNDLIFVENCLNPLTSDSKDPRVDLAHERTDMANYRTQLALDRTTLAWIRTSLTFASFGFGMVGFFRSLPHDPLARDPSRLHAAAIQFGTTLIIIGIVAMTLSSVSHWRALRRLRRGEPPILSVWPLSIAVATLVAVLGLAGLWAIFFV